MARQVVLEILGKTDKLKTALSEAEESSQSFGDKISGVGKLVAGAVATAGVIDFGKKSVEAFTEAAQSQSKLELALKNNAATVGVHAAAFAQLNTELAKHTLADDDAIAATEAQMATFGASESQMREMIPTVMDLAAKMGVDGPAAADMFDKAALGNVKALKALGIEGYKPTGDKANDLANIQGLLADKVKGAAQAQLDAAGPGEKLKKHMDEFEESIGSLLVPALDKLSGLLSGLVDWFTNLSDPVKIAIGLLGLLAGAVMTVNTATKIWKATTEAMEAAQAALNVVMDANPIVLVTLAIIAIGAALIYAYEHSETFRNVVTHAFQGVVNGIGDAVGWILDAVDKVIGAFATMAEAASHIPGIGDKFKGVAETLRDAQHHVQDWADSMHKGINIVKNDADATIGSFQTLAGAVRDVPDFQAAIQRPGGKIPQFADGGIVAGPVGAPVLALVHGGETIIPPGGTSDLAVPLPGGPPLPGGGAGGNTTVYMTVNAAPGMDIEALATAVQKKLLQTGRSRISLGMG